MEPEALLGIAVRALILYVYLLVCVRITGKRSIDSVTPIDFMFGVLIGDLFDDIFWGDVPLANGAVAITVAFIVHVGMTGLSYHFPGFDRRVLGTFPSVVYRSGKWRTETLDRERSRKEEVLMGLREKGEEKLGEVQEAAWESSGQLSVLKREEAREVQKQDLAALKELFK